MRPTTIESWMRVAGSGDRVGLAALLDEDVVFESPVVHTPQQGKRIVLRYLSAAFEVLNTPAFRYRSEWYGPDSAVLEFETVLGAVSVNGVDIIGWGTDGRIRSFKVMVRPLKAIQAVHDRMASELQRLAGG
jgi:hypothetical protein